MARRRVTVLDLVARGPSKKLFGRLMNANLASIMPQAVAAWCEELGHDVRYVCYTGREDLSTLISEETDIVFIGAFTRTAFIAYAISNLYRQRGTVTVLGGPHARRGTGPQRKGSGGQHHHGAHFERDDLCSSHHRAHLFRREHDLRATARVCREGKPVSAFPGHALQHTP